MLTHEKPASGANEPLPYANAPIPEWVKDSLRHAVLGVGLFSLITGLLTLTVPLYMTEVFDRVLSSYSIETLVMLTLIALGLVLLLALLDGVRLDILQRGAMRLEQSLAGPLLKAAVADHLQGHPDASQPLRDLVGLRSVIASPLAMAAFDAPLIVLFVALLFVFHPLLGATALLGALLMLGLSILNQRAAGHLNERGTERMNALLREAEHIARNADAVHAMGLAPALEGHWREGQDRVLAGLMQGNGRGGIFLTATRFTRLALQIALLGLGALLVINAEITAGVMFAASIISARAMQPIETLVGSWRMFLAGRQSWNRINAALARLGRDPAPMPLPTPSGAIDVEQLIVTAGRERRQILKGITFSLKAGESLGITGPAASGKSTLARAVLGVLPLTSVKVRLDGADVAQWPRERLGPHIGYLPQGVELFPGKVADNIARMGLADPEAVIAAAKWAGVHELIMRLPKGYDTHIMSGGLMLTPGQRQRIALARALYGAPKILVLDEPNANLDADGETALIEAMTQAQSRGITLIVIAHRFGILRQIDKLMILREGQIAAFDARDAVLARLTPRPQQEGGATIVPLSANHPRPGATQA
ncbi:MAG: type I secretion system permease/ATPase [Alphaproteobacteria bacterium]|nr:type I secretion system permease/ATPase [Alphaproteobacteria bacterium]